MKYLYSILLASLFFGVVTIYSCGEDDPCEGVVCTNGGCDNGTCVCDDGYTGVDCSTAIREQYLGVWAGPNECSDNLPDIPGIPEIELPTELQITIAEGANNINDIEIVFGVAGQSQTSVTTTLDGNAFIIEPTQTTLPDLPVPLTISGDGIFTNGGTVLNLDYAFSAEVPFLGEIEVPCEASLMKQ